MKVKATNEFKRLGVHPIELGYIPEEGKEFEVTEERFNKLNGNNNFHTIFVKPIEEQQEEPKKETHTAKKTTTKKSTKKLTKKTK